MELNGNRCHQELGTQVCMVTPFDPHELWPGGTRSWASGEVDYVGDDMAGYVGSKTHWTHLTEKDGGTWTTLSMFGAAPTCPYFHQTPNSNASFDTWTEPLSHNSDCT